MNKTERADKTDLRLAEVRIAARELRATPTARKNAVLLRAAEMLERQRELILKANAVDLKRLPKSTKPAFRDRLMLDDRRIRLMAAGLEQVAALPDPVGEVAEKTKLPNGIELRKTRAPLGVILLIFESRPNVAIEAFSLAFKAGNAAILRGGKESSETTTVLYRVLYAALSESGFSRDTLWGITEKSRTLVQKLLKRKDAIDVVVPRGGEGLIEFVQKKSNIPIIKNDRGMCHVYVHDDADLEMAASIVENAKTQRPGVCNAMETVLVNEKVAEDFIPKLACVLEPHGVKWFGCKVTRELLKAAKPARSKSWDTEYLDLMMNCKVVASLDEAIEHIEAHGSRHSEAIVTASKDAARRFQFEVDAAAVYWNASTRFTDGFEFGLGGELGISTQKLHVRGPVGLRELTSLRWIADGEGQVKR
jgi:glutamate-5-semialdehyde dehydrogenase